MSYTTPTLPGTKVNQHGSPGSTSTSHWSDVDANQLSGAIVTVNNNLNTVSGALNTLSGNFDPVYNAANSISSTYKAEIHGGIDGPFNYWTGGISGVLASLSSAFYSSDIPDMVITKGAMRQVTMMFLGTADLTAVFSGNATGSHPTGTYSDLREGHYSLTSSFNALSGNLNSSASNWNTVSGNFNTLSGNLNSSASNWNTYTALSSNLNSSGSRWNSVSSSFDTLSGNLDFSASNWNSVSGSYHTLSGNLNSSASNWNDASSSYHTLSGNLNSSASLWNSMAGFSALSSNLDVSSSNWNAMSSSVSGILNSGSYSTISTAIYLRSPDNTVWKISIGNDGVLSSSVA